MPRGQAACVLSLFLAIAFVTSRPLSSSPSQVLPGNADGLHFGWSVSFVCHQLLESPLRLFEGNIFFPNRRTLLYGEPVIGEGLLALPFWIPTRDANLTYNWLFVLTLGLSAFNMFLLARELFRDAAAAFLAGEVFAFTTANYDTAARIHVASGQWLPLVFFFLVRLWRRRRLRDGLGLGLAFVMQALSCNYYTLYLGTLLLLVSPLLPLAAASRPRLAAVPWRGVALGVGLSLALVGPLWLTQFRQLRALESQWTLRLGAQPLTSYWNVLPSNWLYGGRIGAENVPYDDRYFLGLATLALGAAGLWIARRPGRPGDGPDLRAWLGVFLTLGLLAFALGLGSDLLLPGGGRLAAPYRLFHEWVPGYAQTRVPSRFSIFVRLSAAVFGALAARELSARLRSRGAWRAAALLGLAVLLPLEHVSTPLPAWTLPTGASLPDAYRWLARLPAGTPILEFPQNPSRGRRAESLWMNLSTHHWLPIVNGFGPNYPLGHYVVQDLMVDEFPSVRSLDLLAGLGVRYVVVHPEYRRYPEDERAAARFEMRLPEHADRLRLAARFEDVGRYDQAELGRLGGERIYEIRAPGSPARAHTPAGRPLELRDWRCASVPAEAGCQSAFDGRLDTAFSTRRNQRSGDRLRLSLARPALVQGVSLVCGRAAREYPRKVQVWGRVDGAWQRLARWQDLELLAFVRATLQAPERASLDFSFPAVEVAELELRLGEFEHVLHPWRLLELVLLEPAPRGDSTAGAPVAAGPKLSHDDPTALERR